MQCSPLLLVFPTKVPTVFKNGSKRNRKLLKGLAPQVGFEPTTLRLTAEIQGEALRSEKRKVLKTEALLS